MAALITTTEIGASAVGTDKPAYLLFQPLRLQVQRDLGDAFANYLAEPVFDRHQDKIDWYSNLDGPIAAFDELSQREQIEYIGQVETIRQQLTALATRYIQAANDPARLTIGKALLAAAGEPERRYRYLIGNQPTVVFWGFVQNAKDYPELLDKYIQISQPPKPVEPEPVLTEAEAGTGIEIESQPDQDKTPPIAETARQNYEILSSPAANADKPAPSENQSITTGHRQPFDLLRYAGKVLWGSTLIAGLFFIVVLIFTQFNQQSGLLPSTATPNQAVLDKIRQATTTGDTLQRELANLQSVLADKKCDCVVAKPETDTEEKPGFESTPKEESPTQPEIEQVVESCDIAKLVGRWQSRSNELSNAQSGKPVRVNYDFNVQGLGKIGITEADGSQCQGRASAKFEKSGDLCVLRISATRAACLAKLSSYRSHQVECKLGGEGKAECTLLQKGAQPVYAIFERRRGDR